MSEYELKPIPSSSESEELQADIFANIKVNWKLNVLIFVMALGTLGIFFTALRGLMSINEQQENNYDTVLLPITQISQVDTNLADIQTALVALQDDHLLFAEQAQHVQAIHHAEEQLKPIIESYSAVWLSPINLEFASGLRQTRKNEIEQEANLLQERELASFNQFSEEYAKYSTIIEDIKASIEAGEINTTAIQEGLLAISSSRSAIEQLIEVNKKVSDILNEMNQISYQDVIFRMIISIVLAISFGWLVSYSIARSISKRLDVVQNAARAMEDGYLDRRAVISLSGNDEISVLASTLNSMSRQLQDTLTGLETKVQERTHDLAIATKVSERRAKQFEAITLVSNAITSIRSIEELLPQITQLISLEFGYYHVGIFLNDDQNEYTVLKASNSEGGQHMLARNHRLKIGEQGIVGYATSSGNPRIALDVGEDAVFFNNPDLPQTHSEIALPLKIGNVVVGALDVQSVEPAAFNEDDVRSLSLLADQVSMAIENARLFDQARKSLDEAETVYRQYIRQAWNRLPKEQNLVGLTYTPNGVRQIEKPSDWELLQKKSSQIESEKQTGLISVPLKIRGETIGVLNVDLPSSKEPTTDQMDLIQAVAERVAISAENARLFEETTRRAERERLVSDITTKIRTANDPEVMVQVAIEELKTALGATQVQLLPHVLPKNESINE